MGRVREEADRSSGHSVEEGRGVVPGHLLSANATFGTGRPHGTWPSA